MYGVNKNTTYEAGKVIAALNRSLRPYAGWESTISTVIPELEYEKAEIIFHANQADKQNDTGDILLISLKNKDKSAVPEAVQRLSANPNIAYAEPDYVENLHIIPNDPLFRQLWGMRRTGADMAWNYETGSADVAVGVIDSGIDYNHPDIRKNMWTSPSGRLRYGWNFAENNRDSMDTNGHGSHVAGAIGAVGDNRIGITGMCWNVKVVSMKFGLNVASAIAAIDFANYFNIPILNASWGGPDYSQSLRDAINQYNGLLIASAGNDGIDIDSSPIYPAAYDCENIISVAATNPDSTLARYSNYGIRSVDIAAPGTQILSLGLYFDYSTQTGTSMSAPHVAGAAALLKSYLPDISAAEMKNIILSSAVRNPFLFGRVATTGELNADAMIKLAGRLLTD